VKLQERILHLDDQIRDLEWKLVRLDNQRRRQQDEQATSSVGSKLEIDGLKASAQEKLRDPKANPVMTLGETRALFGKSRSSIYRWIEEGKLKRAALGRKPGERSSVLILTTSVLRALQEDAE
jgi:hypothetical protein